MSGFADDPRFKRWREAKPWSLGTATFGPTVIDDLVAGVDRFAASVPGAAAMGCVYMLTNSSMANSLTKLEAVCIVLDKGASREAATRIEADGGGMPMQALPELGGFVRPYGGGFSDIGPMRVTGFRRSGQYAPLLHAKVLVLGRLDEYTVDTGVGQLSGLRFEPERAWIGSANWTNLSRSHLEIGVWVDDPKLVDDASDFVQALIAYSEPFTSKAVVPTPELVQYEPDYESLALDDDPWDEDAE